MFTSNQVEELRKKLQLSGVKDSSLPTAKELTGTESVAIVQAGESKKIGIDYFISSINKWCKSDLLNITKDSEKAYSIEDAILTLPIVDYKEGQIITFIDKKTGTWVLYQYNGKDKSEWHNSDSWVNILDTADYHFRGYFLNEELLKKNYPRPQIGDFAFIGTTLEEAVTYTCINYGNWYNTKQPSLPVANKFKAVYSEDFSTYETTLDGFFADRANADAEGNVIHKYYTTRLSFVELEKRVAALEGK